MELHSKSRVSGVLSECTIGDVSSKQGTACSLLRERAALLYYCVGSVKRTEADFLGVGGVM